MKRMQVLLVNPPIYDFTAYDFWLRPYGMLRVAGQISNYCGLSLFDYLPSRKRDPWGRGHFDAQDLSKPEPLYDVPRKFHRFGKLAAFEVADQLAFDRFVALVDQPGGDGEASFVQSW